MVIAIAAAAAVLFLRRQEPAPRWNVLLVSVDTLRADHLSAYGARELRTPHIDRLASEGVLFEDVQTVAPTTLPAHASLFTGLNPPRHRVRDNLGFYLGAGPATLAERLEASGYDTAAFVGAFVLDSRFGLDRGFAHYDDDMGASGDSTEAGFVAQRRGDRVLDRALAWLSGRPDGDAARPFFAFIHFYDPHAPYEPPGAVSGASDFERYLGEVAFVDGLVGRLLDRLDENQLAERTLVALVSDHGESLGEHGEMTHGFFVYRSTLAIPYLMRYPGAPAGRRVSGTARIIDVAPTLLDLLGLPPIEGAEGASLVASIDRGAIDPAPLTYAETFLPRLHFGWSPLRSLRRGSDKLILAPRPELYDLSVDPDETANRIGERAGLASELRSALEAIDTTTDPVVAGDVDAETLERLRSLGYAGSGTGLEGSGDSASLPDPKDRLEIYRVVNDPLYQRIGPADPGFEAALRRLEEVLEEDPGVLRAYTLEGELLLKAGREAQAQSVFARLVEVRDDSFEGHYGLGVARQRLGKWEEAVAALERALAIEPRNTKVHLRLSEVAAARGDLESAEAWLRRAIEIAPDRFLRDRLAQVLIDAGKPSEARALLSEMASTEDDALAAENLGRLLLAEGDLEGAIGELRRALALDAESADAHLALGNALALAGRPEEAIGAFQSAMRLSPCLAPALANLGSAYGQLGRFEEAAEALERAVACDPAYASAYRNLAAVQLELGHLAAAIEAMRSAVRASPDDPELRQALSELEAYRRR